MYTAAIFSYIKYVSLHPLLRITAWFNLYCLHRAIGNGKQAKVQNENICLQRESNQRPLAFQRGASNHSAMMTVNDCC